MKKICIAIVTACMSVSAFAVEYDLTLALSRPTELNESGELDADGMQIDAFYFVSETKGLVAAAGTAQNVSVRALEGGYDVKGHLKKGFGLNQNYTYFVLPVSTQPTYNGKYEIVIDKGAFGDEAWVANNEDGKSNDEIKIEFTLIGAADREIYTIEPESITPEPGEYAQGSDFSEITIKFAESVEMAEDAYATLGTTGSDYLESAKFEKTGEGVFTVSFPAPGSIGTYIFSVTTGQFGDAKFIAGEEGGKGNASITLEYELSKTNAVDKIDAGTEEKEIYNLSGTRVGKDIDSLPAGIYVTDGRKVLKK